VIVVPLTEEVATTEMFVSPDGVVGIGVDGLLPPPPHDTKLTITEVMRIASVAWRFRGPMPTNAIPTTLKLANATNNPAARVFGRAAGNNSEAIPAVWKTSVEVATDVPAVTFEGVKAHVELTGKLPHDRLTGELNPPNPAIEMVIMADWPARKVAALGWSVMPKSATLTVIACVVDIAEKLSPRYLAVIA
jgi:hypothetical protein